MKRTRYETYSNRYLENVIETQVKENEDYETRLKQDYNRKLIDALMFMQNKEKQYMIYKLKKRGLTSNEIGEIFNMSATAVRMSYMRMCEKMTNIIQELNIVDNKVDELILSKQSEDSVEFTTFELKEED